MSVAKKKLVERYFWLQLTLPINQWTIYVIHFNSSNHTHQIHPNITNANLWPTMIKANGNVVAEAMFLPFVYWFTISLGNYTTLVCGLCKVVKIRRTKNSMKCSKGARIKRNVDVSKRCAVQPLVFPDVHRRAQVSSAHKYCVSSPPFSQTTPSLFCESIIGFSKTFNIFKKSKKISTLLSLCTSHSSDSHMWTRIIITSCYWRLLGFLTRKCCRKTSDS